MQTLIFDCDGVLVDSEVIAEATLIERLSEWLPDVDVEQALAQALGQTTEAILLGLEALSAHALPQAALALLDDEIEARLAQELDAIEGAAAAITVVDLPKAVVSNSRRCRVVASLSKTGLDRVLQGAPIFCAEQVERPKPDPAVYQLAANTLGVMPGNCLVVEDSVSGARAARAAGMTVIGFVGASHVPAGQADRLSELGVWRVMQRMAELPGLVEDWRSEQRLKA
ncbi:HAD-IA family hydrolase [Halomonas binhaiensis]|uniref:HAD-IA family hydrolase n=1 Tax=Halomonas binhaiensis TaxID=2562282 RepID=A0A5C1NLK6_9GAMM|nr:HAD-IA family hydrolase [Halomonas binhaiensis]QEM83297.1 HAD-IA family hydrolase [Halomonas binhaiensis]